MSRILLLRTRDPLVERRAARVAALVGAEPVILLGPVPQGDGEPVGLLVELELEGALDAVRGWRARLPELTIVGFVAMPEPELWREAETAGADAVTNRGNADRVLRACLEDRLSGRRRARRLRLAPLADFAGRLGYVGRVDQTPAGPIALYHLAGRLWAAADVCPHAGASLCEGELNGDVITCPRHGSQFRVTDGARVRGPADVAVRTFPVVIEAGDAFVELPE
ncbi:MAG TPA: Rieske 2Fe-2S domain-containing protein [Solirubrobacteraceae bacterium]|nr:Rieske 2Fe-2S domain-containing protein [Solirubrobacteraceae bacterium]